MNRVVLGVIAATFVIAVVLGRYTFGRIDRLTVPWRVAWLKTLVIVVGITALVVILPGWVMTLESVADMDRMAQDLVGTGVFGAGLGASLWLLWWAHRESRI